MKTRLLLTAALIALTITACTKSAAPMEEKEEEKRARSDKQNPIELAIPLATAFTDFSFHFFKNLQTEQEADANIFVSPLSLHIALGMLVNGAQASTKAEIMKALKSDHLSQTDLNGAYQKLITELPKADPLVKMALANAIFYKNNFQVETPFLNSMKTTFNAQITALPFVQSDLATINKWASDNTEGKIKEVLKQLNPDLMMLLMNALYFKGDWRAKFDKKNTKEQPFTLDNGSSKTVKMMNQKDTFQLASSKNFTALQMPYGNGQFRATLILPKDGKTITTTFDELDETQWSQLQSGFSTQTVEVGLPKFKLEQEFELNKTLEKMGMVKAFYPGAELQGINKTAPLKVDFVKQNTFATVDEEGTEGAAVTIVGIEVTCANCQPAIPKFICDRPFGIIISEKTSNIILFMGRIMNPEE